ncbi:MAG: hypothetical protein JO300_11785 [Silvibacterium sp.]|nr:hypothetical protein [Silvibacterium sp.]
MPSWLHDIKTALASVGGIAHYDAIYAEVARMRPSPLPGSWKEIVRRTIQDHASESNGFRGTAVFYSVDGIGSGVWGLRELLKPAQLASDIGEPEAPQRVQQQVYRVLRDTEMTRKLKALYKDTCQLCGLKLMLADGSSYSEAHHVQPLGRPHNGPDIAANILVLCPNHHVLLDYGAMDLHADELHAIAGHRVGSRYIEYHNKNIAKPEMR